MHWTITTFLLLTTFFGNVRTANDCPDEEEIQPCKCYINEEGMNINCNQPSLYHLVRAFEKLRGKQIQKVILDEPDIPFIPESLFKQTNLSHILLYGPSMASFQGPRPEKSPFLGVENTLHTIEVLWPKEGKSNYNWSDLTVLKNLKELRILGLHLPTIEKFPPIPSLTILTLQHTLTDNLVDDAFVNLSGLERINIQDNNLTSIKRSVFIPRAKLQRINLSANRLVDVPTDMFADMPDLEILTIAYNRIKYLPVQPFQIANTLTLDFTGNRIICTCDLKWLKDMAREGRLRFQGECSNVRHVNARNIMTFIKKCK